MLLVTCPHQAGTWESLMSPTWAVKPGGDREEAGCWGASEDWLLSKEWGLKWCVKGTEAFMTGGW